MLIIVKIKRIHNIIFSLTYFLMLCLLRLIDILILKSSIFCSPLSFLSTGQEGGQAWRPHCGGNTGGQSCQPWGSVSLLWGIWGAWAGGFISCNTTGSNIYLSGPHCTTLAAHHRGERHLFFHDCSSLMKPSFLDTLASSGMSTSKMLWTTYPTVYCLCLQIQPHTRVASWALTLSFTKQKLHSQ